MWFNWSIIAKICECVNFCCCFFLLWKRDTSIWCCAFQSKTYALFAIRFADALQSKLLHGETENRNRSTATLTVAQWCNPLVRCIWDVIFEYVYTHFAYVIEFHAAHQQRHSVMHGIAHFTSWQPTRKCVQRDCHTISSIREGMFADKFFLSSFRFTFNIGVNVNAMPLSSHSEQSNRISNTSIITDITDVFPSHFR